MANRLAASSSPYLLQHADNPVDWWEWGTEAFAPAREREVPILLSVGYAACHWCHVMAHESFEDPEIAAVVNDGFVSVKVDREERPDVDAVYMAATTGPHRPRRLADVGACSPPTGEPFLAGTYLPRAPARWPSWPTSAQVLGHPARPRCSVPARASPTRLREHAGPTSPHRHDAADVRRRGAPAAHGPSTPTAAASAARPSSRRRWSWSS